MMPDKPARIASGSPHGVCFSVRPFGWVRILAFCLFCLPLAGCKPGGREAIPPHAPESPSPVELTAEVDRAKVKVGEPIFFRITLEADPDIAAEPPEAGSRIEGLRIVDMGVEGPKKREGRIRSQRWYELRADFTGSYILPALRLSYLDAEGKDRSAETEQIFVEVESVLGGAAEAEDIRDLKPLEKARREIPGWWPLPLIGSLGVIGLLVGLFLHLRRKRRTGEAHRTAEEIARLELEDLEASGVLEEERYREYVFGLSLILRRYLERRFGLPAAEQTTEEVLQSLRKAKHLDTALKDEARAFLEETDPIKYRGLEPRPAETEAWRGRLVAFLQHAAAMEDTREAA
jgi:hypothetical protein